MDPVCLPFFGLPGPYAHLLGAVTRNSEYYRHALEVSRINRYGKGSSYIAARFHPDLVGTPRRLLKRHGDYAPGPQSLRLAFGMSTSKSAAILFFPFYRSEG